MTADRAQFLPPSVMSDEEKALADKGVCPKCRGPLEARSVASPDGAMRFANCRECNNLYVLASLTAVAPHDPRGAPPAGLLIKEGE